MVQEENAPLGLLEYITKQREDIRDILDLKEYLMDAGDGLWAEFSSFRREQEYSNGNYISEGLTDGQTIAMARDFIATATAEIIKAAELQHTISGSLHNYLAMPEFEGISEKLNLGNWIHLMVDDKLYKLRITSIEIDYDSISNINVEFSDVIRGGDTMSDIQSILSKSQSMATTYNYVSHQAKRGNEASNYLENAGQVGLDLTTMKIINDLSNENLQIDGTGILMRRKNDFDDDYSPEQTRIINNGLYYTTDNWATTSSAIGKFVYYDPDAGEERTGYGVIANQIVGSLFLGNEMRIYSSYGGVTMDENGLTINTNAAATSNTPVFTVQKCDEHGTPIQTYMSIDSDGDFSIDANTLVMSIDDATIEFENYPTYDDLSTEGECTVNAANISGVLDNSHVSFDGITIALSSNSTAVTQTSGDDSTKIATTAFVQAALAGKQDAIDTVTVSIAQADWSSNVCTKTVSGLGANDNVIVTYAPGNRTEYKSAGIYCSAQAAGSLTFTCTTTPTTTVDVNVMIIS